MNLQFFRTITNVELFDWKGRVLGPMHKKIPAYTVFDGAFNQTYVDRSNESY